MVTGALYRVGSLLRQPPPLHWGRMRAMECE